MTEKEISENRQYNAHVLMRIRQKCVEKNTSITKIEETLGYGNGSVSTAWARAKKKAPADRIEKIAALLDCDPCDLTDWQKETPAAQGGELGKLSDMERAVIEAYRASAEARARMDFEVEQYKKSRAQN